MTKVGQHKGIPTYVVLATVAVLVLGPGWATAAYNRDTNQQQYQDQDQGAQSYQPPPRAAQSQGRDMRLEQQIANRLRQQGYGAQGEIMILATDNRVILLGTVLDNKTKDGAEKAAKQIATRQAIDNRLHVNAQAKRIPDAQLAKDTNDKLSDELSQNVQVQARNGTVTLQGQLDNWRQVADAIDAAFAAGASQVNSQFSVAGAGAMARGGAAGGAYPSYGYTPGLQGQPPYPPRARQGAMGGPGQASSADLRLARQVADQLRQELPPGQNVQPIQPQSIYIMVRQGTVTLNGYVQNSNQKQQAEQIAQSINGVQNVRNNLIILSTRGAAGQGGQGYGASNDQSFGGTSSQSGSYQPQGYISPDQGNQSQQGMSSQDQSSSQSSSQQGFGDQDQYSQGGQAGSQMGGRQVGMRASDMALAQKVVQQLKQQLSGVQNIQIMRPGTIYVTALQGTVMLGGVVPSSSISQQAAQIARGVPGVRNLQNTLRAGQPASGYPSYGYIPGQEQPGAAAQGMAGQNQGMQGMQGQNQGAQGSAQMQYIAGSGQMGAAQSGQSDMALAQQIAQKLRQQLTGVPNIQVARPGTIYVIVNKGAVTLDGLVSSNNLKQKAEQLAKSVSGVQNVKNSLSIYAAAPGSQAYGYVPGDEDQAGAAQYGNQRFGNMSGNRQSGNQFGYMPPDEDQSGMPQFENKEFGNRSSMEDQAGDDQPDEGTN